jgi:uncharacterized phage protein (TIGR02218 family)
MKDTSAALVTHQQGIVATLAKCTIIALRSGAYRYFTDHTSDLLVDGNNYVSGAGVTRSAVQQKAGAAADNLELMGIIDDAEVTNQDILSSLYQDAEMWTFEVNYNDTAGGKSKMTYGVLGEIEFGDDGTFKIKHRGISSRYDNAISRKYGRRCDYTLGDANCGVTVSDPAWTKTGTLTGVTTRRTVTDTARTEADDFFQYGKLIITSGENSGIAMDIKSSSAAGVISTTIPFPFNIVVGDTYVAVAGCNHLLKDAGDVWGAPYTGHCAAKFDNAVKFPGHPEIPGNDFVLGGGGL